MTTGFDSYGAVPASAFLASDGYIGRYVSLQPGKCIAPAEIPVYHGAKRSLVLVYEDGADDALGGANAGSAKAHIARPILDAIHWPAHLPVYFACDFSITFVPDAAGNMHRVRTDPHRVMTLAEWPEVHACVTAFAAGIGRPAAIYGDVNACTAAHQAGITYTWQFGIGRAPSLSIYQGYPPVGRGGFAVDPDTAYTADFGQWAPDPPKPPKPPTPKEHLMYLTTDPNNDDAILVGLEGWCGLGAAELAYWRDKAKLPTLPAPSAEVFASWKKLR